MLHCKNARGRKSKMQLFNRLWCAIGRHTADRGQARHDLDYWWSSCKVCDTRLVRDPVKGWRTPTTDEVEAHRRKTAGAAK